MKYLIMLFTALYLPVVVLVGLVWSEASRVGNAISFFLWQLIIAKVVLEIARMILALFLPKAIFPQLETLQEYPPVALLYTCRDDVVVECLEQLTVQEYPNYRIFILDDSSTENYGLVDAIVKRMNREMPRERSITVLRRGSLRGFKAGNLNHWLARYGEMFKYFIVFDSDSKAKPDFITQMTRYAEHRDNHDIAIFQSQVLPWNDSALYRRLVGALAPFYARIVQRVGNRTGTVISFGHNNLHRVDAIMQVNGFSTQFSSEDTAATFELNRIGFRTAAVETVSFESEPEDIFLYKRRAVRWASQTGELFQRSWRDVSWPLKFELSRQLLYYAINALFFIWMFASLWDLEDNITLITQYIGGVVAAEAYSSIYFVTFALVISLLALQFGLHFWLALRSGVKVRDYLGHMFLSLGLFLFTVVPVSLNLLRALAGKQVVFVPSNRDRENAYSFRRVLGESWWLWLSGLLALGRYLLLGKNPWLYFGGWWAAALVLLPAIVHLAHLPQIRKGSLVGTAAVQPR